MLDSRAQGFAILIEGKVGQKIEHGLIVNDYFLPTSSSQKSTFH